MSVSDFSPDPAPWRPYTRPGERLLWAGRPRTRFVLDHMAAMLCLPAAMLALAYLLLPSLLSALGLSVGLIGVEGQNEMYRLAAAAALVYLTAYLLWHSLIWGPAYAYAVTDSRAIIVRRLPWKKVTVTYLTPLTPLNWSGGALGDVIFADELVSYGSNNRFEAPTFKEKAVGFVGIPDPDRVYQLIKQVMEGDRIGGPRMAAGVSGR